MHPVREWTISVSGFPDSPDAWPVGRLELGSDSLHLTTPMPERFDWAEREAYILPSLDLVVSRFVPRSDSGRVPPRAYIDMASVKIGPERWTMRDLYLDVIVQPDGVPVLVDEDEYAEAVLEGHLTPDEQRRALQSAARVVNGLYRHGTLEAWLETLSVQLDWWSETRAAGVSR